MQVKSTPVDVLVVGCEPQRPSLYDLSAEMKPLKRFVSLLSFNNRSRTRAAAQQLNLNETANEINRISRRRTNQDGRRDADQLYRSDRRSAKTLFSSLHIIHRTRSAAAILLTR